MFRRILILAGALLNIFWGISHLFPTGNVVRGFGSLSDDNSNIILMEWINEGLTLIFIGILVSAATLITKKMNRTLRTVYTVSALMLFSMAVLSLFTGFNIDFLPFRLCPLLFTVSGILILQGAFIKNETS